MPPQPLEGFTTAGPSPGLQHQHQQSNHHQQQQLMMNALQPAPEAAGPRPGYIPLTMLIDFIIQKTYHDLTVLAELLPRKTDMERKIEIYNFTARTKQLFIRLLALVKWASSSSKVEKSCDIMTFLDKQSMLFVDTADALSRISREMLVNARLPNFQIPEAIEVLTTGTYSRLPTCIKDRIVPMETLVGPERKQTLLRLNQIIQHRLVTGCSLPQQMRNFKIENGRVQFRVEQEFEVGLTLMSDDPNVPWRMLEIEILVEDTETGSSNTSLVHFMQLGFIHQLVQARLACSTNPVQEVYNCLHFFCQSLQLEVLFGQTMHLKQHRLNDSVQVDEYVRGSKLTVSYWRDLLNKSDPRSDLVYRLTVQTDPIDSARPLAVMHLPSIGNKESADMADRAVRTDRLSMERLLVHTVYIRSLARLSDMRAEFQTFLKDVEYHLRGTPAILTVPILMPCHDAEKLHVSVDTHTGQLRCHVPKYPVCPLTNDLQSAMNGDHSRLPALVIELRFWLARRRCERSLQKLPVVAHEHLPIGLDIEITPEHAAIVKNARNKIFVRYNQQPNVMVVVEMTENPERVGELLYTFHLLYMRAHPVTMMTNEARSKHPATKFTSTRQSGASKVTDSANETVVEDVMALESTSLEQSAPASLPKIFLTVEKMTAFDTFAITHGPSAPLFEQPPQKRCRLTADAPVEYHSSVAYLVPELTHTIAMFADKLPFVALASELGLRGIPHSGVQTEVDASVVCLKILSMPRPSGLETAPSAATFACVTTPQWSALQHRLLAVCVRQQLHKNLHTRSWSVELVLAGSPLPDDIAVPTTSMRHSVQKQYEMGRSEQVDTFVDALLRDWACVVYLYGLVHEFAEQLRPGAIANQDRLRTICTIRSYNYTKLQLGYGPQHESLVTIRWCADRRGFRLAFARLNSSTTNPHTAIATEMEVQLNRHFSIARLVHLLHETYRPLSALGMLDIIPHYGIPRPTVPVLTFCLLPQTPTLLRLAYQAIYCLELRILGGGMVSIRDGANSRFAKQTPSTSVDEFKLTQGLLGFLRKYAVDSAATASPYLRRMQGEEDSPVSPSVQTNNSMGTDDPDRAVTASGVVTNTLPPLCLSYVNGTLGKSTGPHSPNNVTVGLRFPTSVTPPPTPASPMATNHTTATSPASHSHSMHTTNSAGALNNHNSTTANGGVPSPLTVQQRPGSAPIQSPQSTAHVSSNSNDQHSPFNVQSPASTARASPRLLGSVGANASTVPATPRSALSGRAWAGAVPTMLSVDALEVLLRPSAHPVPDVPGPMMCPLERFLGCVNMRWNLQRYIHSEDFLTPVECSIAGAVAFRVDSLQFQVSLDHVHMQSLHLKVRQADTTCITATNPATTTASSISTSSSTASPPVPSPTAPVHQWSALDLQTIERYFELRVAAPPYRPNTLFGFCRMLNVPALVLRDFLQIVRVEMQPEAAAEAIPGLRWQVQLLLRVPPSAPVIVPTGNAAVHMIRQKILFFLQITRLPIGYTAASSSPPTTPLDDVADEPHSERPSLVIPMVYDVNANITQLAERRDATGTITSSATNSASQLLRRFAELHKTNAATTGECSIFPAIRELLTNYVMPRPDSPTTTATASSATNASNAAAEPAQSSTQTLQQQSVPSQSIVNTIVGGTANKNGSSAKVTISVSSAPSGSQSQKQQQATITN